MNIDSKTDSKDTIKQKFVDIKKEDTTDYLNEIKQAIEKKLQKLSSDEIFNSDGFVEHIPSVLEKYLYLLRHNMHHIGELNKTLRDNNKKRIDWI